MIANKLKLIVASVPEDDALVTQLS